MSVSENDNQSVQQPSGSENPTKPVEMLTYFWWTILTLISVTGVLLILATLNQNPQPEEERKVRIEQGKEAPQSEEELRARVEKRKGHILGKVLRPELFQKTDKAIDKKIDTAFAPIYEQIPKFLDWHYSVSGQYQQLSEAAFGDLESEMEEWLLSGVHERLEDASAKINEIFKAEFRSLIEQKIQDELQTVDKASRDVYEKMLTKAMQNSIQRFTASVAGPGLAAFQVAIAGIFGAITKKLLASVAIKTGGKTAAKIVGSAASGAAVGSFLGPIGTAVGGTLGAIFGWFAVDAAVVNVDAHFNRADFEQELIALIDERKDEVKSSMQEAKSKIIEEESKTLDSVLPSQM